MVRTKYGYVIDRCAKIIKANSGTNGKFRQKIPIDAPNAIEGTIKGTLDNTSNAVEAPLPHLFLAIRTATGRLKTTFRRVTTVATTYDRRRLCQYPCHTPVPAIAWLNVPPVKAPITGKTINRDGINTITMKTRLDKESLSAVTLKSLSFLSA
jgi:hypothetical protein